MLLMCSLNGLKTVEQIREKLKDFIEKNPEMDKIQGIGWDDATFGVEGPKAEMTRAFHKFFYKNVTLQKKE